MLPAALAIAALVVSVVLMAPLLATQAQQAMAGQLNRLPAAQLEAVQAQMALFRSPLFIGAVAAATGVLGLLVGWLLQSALFFFGAMIAGGEADFGRLFAAVPWVNLPFVLETIVRTAYVASRGQLIVNEGLSYLVSSGKPLEDARNLAYVALSQASLFRLWHLVLVYFLLRVGTKLERGGALALTLIYALLAVGGQLALATLSRLTTVGL